MPRLRVSLLCMLLASFLSPLVTPARAQHGGGGGHGGGGRGGGGMGPGFPPGGGYGLGEYRRDNGDAMPGRAPGSAGSVPGMRSNTHLGPMGRWWDDKHFAKDLKLRPGQQQHMDIIFESMRPVLAKSLQDYQQEQGRLEVMYTSKTLDESTLYTQIDRVSQARAELGKVYTHYLLQIRAEMDTDQLSKLDAATRKQQ